MADALNMVLNIITLPIVGGAIWWLTRWERRDRHDHRAVARAVDRFAEPDPDSLELSRTLVEVRRRRADEQRSSDRFIAGYLDGLQHRPPDDSRPPLRAV